MCCAVAEFCIASREFPAAVFVNPHAGGGRARRCLSPIKRIFAERSFPADFIFTESTEALESYARSAIQAGRRVLLAMGGDGTLQALVNAAHRREVVLGILPTGGGNDFAAALGCRRIPSLPQWPFCRPNRAGWMCSARVPRTEAGVCTSAAVEWGSMRMPQATPAHARSSPGDCVILPRRCVPFANSSLCGLERNSHAASGPQWRRRCCSRARSTRRAMERGCVSPRTRELTTGYSPLCLCGT